MSPRTSPVAVRLRRTLHRPGLLGAVLVAATLAVAAALADQAARAADSHRLAVETALEHHASTAAWRFAREARSWLSYGMEEAGTKLRREIGPRATLPGPEVLHQVLAEQYCDCMTAAFGRTFARVVPGDTDSLDLIGERLSERAREELRERLLALAADRRPQQRERLWWIFPPGWPRLNRGTDVVLAWRVNGPDRMTRAMYAMIVERAQLERPLSGAIEEAQFFPPALVPRATAKALVRIEVAGPNHAAIFASGPETHRFAGTDTLGTDYGQLVATATVNPAAAQVLVAGGLPASRVPMILALFVLALAMGGAAGLLLRREHRLGRLREDFVSGVSHELRTPLTQIRMLSELLETDSFKSPAERARAVGIIHRESLRLTNLVDNVLEFTRLRRSATAPPVTRVSLAEVLREVADTLAPLVEARGSRIDLAITEDAEIRGDRDAVSRVVRNLIENAVKYGPPSQTISVTLAPASSNGSVRIGVEDQGPGIPPAERSRIWQAYYRLDRDRNAPGGGSGLGLSVVADLVDMLGGTVAVSDAPGGGARFTVDLPRAP